MARLTKSDAITAVTLAAGFVAAVFVRTWRLTPHARIPDTYEHMSATRRLLSGEFPLSDLYPPGVALVLAPFFAIFPDTVTTVQAAVVLFSLVLIALAYVTARRAGADTVTTLIFTAAIAFSPAFVTMSRVGLFDAIGTALLVASIVAAPSAAKARWPAWLAFALLLSVAITVRSTNVFVLPAVMITYADLGRDGARMQRLRAHVTSPPALVIGLLTCALFLLLAIPGLISGSSNPVNFAFGDVPQHVLFYQVVAFGGFALPMVAVLLAFGVSPLWRRAPSLVLVAIYLLIVWPVAHAPFPFVNERYMLLPWFFTLLIAVHGPIEVWRSTRDAQSPFRALRRATGITAQFLIVALFAVGVFQTLSTWPDDVGLSDESALEELRPVVASFDDDALIITALARGFDHARDDRAYLDLIDHRIEMRDRSSSVAEIVATIEQALDDRRAVYYVYSRFEEAGENAGLGGDGLDIYFTGVEARFRVSEMFRAQQPEYRIYRVTQPP
ncbi:MAG: glycosyltransferase family 39 protein [Dehalococcoidia bacterium]